MLVGVTLLVLLITPLAQQASPYFSISGCRDQCPANPIYSSSLSSSLASVVPAWVDAIRASAIFAWLAAAGLVAWRFVTGTPPRRRALSIGTPVALLFLLASAAYQMIQLVNPQTANPKVGPETITLQWAVAASRSAIWYGFLLALIAAQLFAGRALRRLVGRSLGRPSFSELEEMLRQPLGDPGLRLGFWRKRAWVDAVGAVLPPSGPGQTLTEVKPGGQPKAAILHDEQLAEDPELLQTAGAVALLAVENAELDAAWKESLRDLADSRARLVSAGDSERRKLERDLHDGAQQGMLAAMVTLSVASDQANDNPNLSATLSKAEALLEQRLEELRELAHGLYPTELTRSGLGGAIGTLAQRSGSDVGITEGARSRFPPEIEGAMYYCCLEALQNANKHGGPHTHTSIRLYTDAQGLHLQIRDDGPGFEPDDVNDGVGLQNMRDRLGAVGGSVEIVSEPGRGTLVAAVVPLTNRAARGTTP